MKPLNPSPGAREALELAAHGSAEMPIGSHEWAVAVAVAADRALAALPSPPPAGGIPEGEDATPYSEALTQLVQLDAEAVALSGGGPNWRARWDAEMAEAAELVRREP